MLLLLAGAVAAPPTASAVIDWRADAERQWIDEWAGYACQSSSRFVRVASPSNQLRNAYRFEVRDGDDNYGERCEVGQGNPTRSRFPLFEEGEERWISFQVYLPDDYPIDVHSWNVIHQLKQLGGMGTPVLSMEVQRGRFYLMNSTNSGESCCTDVKWSGPARRNHWVKFSLRVKFSPNPDVGFVKLYGDLDGDGQKLLMPRIHTHTMKRDSAGRGIPSHSRIGIYRDSRISGTSHIYFDGYTVAADRGEVEKRAFERPLTAEPPPVGQDWTLRLNDRRAGLPYPRSVPPVRYARILGAYRGPRTGATSVHLLARRNDRWVRVARTPLGLGGRFAANVKMRLPASTRRVRLLPVVPTVGRGESSHVSLRP